MALSAYPEEAISYCEDCRIQIPVTEYWLGRGTHFQAGAAPLHTLVLHNQCPQCGARRSVALIGPLWYRTLWGWLWRMRYAWGRDEID